MLTAKRYDFSAVTSTHSFAKSTFLLASSLTRLIGTQNHDNKASLLKLPSALPMDTTR